MNIPDLYAYVGEDELGSGEVGLKAGLVPAGYIPLVVVDRDRYKLERDEIVEQLGAQAREYKKEIRLVHYIAVETVLVIPVE